MIDRQILRELAEEIVNDARIGLTNYTGDRITIVEDRLCNFFFEQSPELNGWELVDRPFFGARDPRGYVHPLPCQGCLATEGRPAPPAEGRGSEGSKP